MMLERAELLKSFDGTNLYFRCFTPRRNRANPGLKGVVLAVHGFAEHSGRYAKLARIMCEQNMAFACFDLRGHGQSGPRRGDVENLHAMVLDVVYVVNHTKEILALSNKSDTFFGLFGHSFGAVLLTYVASILSDTCPPIFLSSPAYKLRQKHSLWKKIAAQSLPRLAPNVMVPLEFMPENLSENPENNAAFVADELNLFSVTARFGEVFAKAIDPNLIKQSATHIKSPVTILCGKKDKLYDTDIVKEVFPLIPSDKNYLEFIEDAGHEIFNELPLVSGNAEQVLTKWLENKGTMIRD